MLTWAGQVATQVIASATSSATSGSGDPGVDRVRPLLIAAEAVEENSSVRTIPGATSHTRTGWSNSSSRSVSVTTLVPCFAAV